MEFLKGIFGDKPLTFEEFTRALEASKDIKLANLATGQYVDKAKFDGKDKEHQEATALIAELKKGNAGNESLQAKISEYETRLSELETENHRIKVDAAVKVALLEAKAVDIDYLTFKLKEKGELTLSEDGTVKGIGEAITGLRTQFPAQFSADPRKKVDEKRLPDESSTKQTGVTPEQFRKMGYQDRLKLHQQDPEAYKELTSTINNEKKEVNQNGE